MSLQTTDLFVLSRSGAAYNVSFETIRQSLLNQPRGRVQANGTAQSITGASITRTNAGRYRVQFDPQLPDAAYPILLSLEQNSGRDDYVITYTGASAEGFNVEISEQDNGAAAGTFRDAGFSFFIPL